jgi:predicted nucleic acid-binding protein
MIAIDTNLLVYAHRSAVPEHRAAQRAIERAAADGGGWGVALASLAEFWAVATHPAASFRPSSAREAGRYIDALIEGGAQIWTPGPGFGRRLLQVAAALDVKGPRVFDLQIALTVFESGATELWTADRSFATVPGLTLANPL